MKPEDSTDQKPDDSQEPVQDHNLDQELNQVVEKESPPSSVLADDAEVRMRTLSRASFLKFGGVVLASSLGLGWLLKQGEAQSLLWPLRRMLELNEKLGMAGFDPARLAPTFSIAQAGMPRTNGDAGLEKAIDIPSWRLQVSGIGVTGGSLQLRLDEIKALPHQDVVTDLKCIEGWSQIVHWGGVRFRDFVARYYPALARDPSLVPYVGLETPDGEYYVGLDMASALHPQTLLCYAMNGAALTEAHGAPLRLIIPVKYGIKYLKRIGRIKFSQTRPADYWAERGYDWFSGL